MYRSNFPRASADVRSVHSIEHQAAYASRPRAPHAHRRSIERAYAAQDRAGVNDARCTARVARRPNDIGKRGGKWSCTRRRSAPARTRHRVRLQPGSPTAPEGNRLPLLPSGSDGVHEPSLRGTRLSTSDEVVVGERRSPRPGIQLRCSGLRIQGTASSPPSTTGAMVGLREASVNRRPLHIRSGALMRRMHAGAIRRGGEGGIRTLDGLPRTAFPVPRHRPLGDLSEDRLHAWRRGWDSNPRYGCPHTAFRERHLQPLGHLSSPRAESSAVTQAGACNGQTDADSASSARASLSRTPETTESW